MWVSLVVILPLLWKGITCLAGYSIQVSPSVSVQEGLCVTIPCTFTANSTKTFSNSSGYWLWRPYRATFIVATNDKSRVVKKPNFYLKGNPDTGDCTLTITDARREDTGTYYFRFEESKESRVKYNYMKTTITVTDLTEEPVMSDLGTVTAGIDKTVTCSPPGNCSATSLVFQWKKSDVSGIWKTSPTITFTPSLYDHQKTITCEMANSKGNTTKKTILLDVCCPTPVTVTWEEINEKKQNKLDSVIKVTEGSSVIIRCSVQSQLTLDVTWTVGKNKVLRHETGKDLELRLENMTMNDTGTYTCSALTMKDYVINSTNINITVQYPPRNMEITVNSPKDREHRESPIMDLDQNETLTLTCRADGSPPVTVGWARGEDDTETSITSNNGLSAVINVTSSQADVYRCLAWNGLGLRERRIQIGTRQDPPRNMTITVHSSKGEERLESLIMDIDQTETLTLACKADGNPPSTVVWLRGEVNHKTSQTNNSKLPAVMNVTSSEADVYRCLAWNELGFTEQRIQIGTKQGIHLKPDIAIGFICGMLITALIILLYKLCTGNKLDKKKMPAKREEQFSSEQSPTPEIYMNTTNPDHSAEGAAGNDIQVESRDAALDVLYSSINFAAKRPKVPASQPETEYAEVKRK
ncbi:sialic acid-binding Ig-like lectin 16 [Dendropsophus ebraccatus]|uniref:sialic acid-binding Ig-like lectin 16 n=1 Tax=Dendropsophus ebraccatus TaxID=150705 RepID=UPI003831A91D